MVIIDHGGFFARAGIFWAIRQENNLHCGRRVEIWPFGAVG